MLKTLMQFMKNRSKHSKLIEKGNPRSLYRTPDNCFYWLDEAKYLDKCIINTGIFEEKSTEAVKLCVKPGNIVFDIGANIGYYSVLMSKLIEPAGKVFCFEPTMHYRQVLKQNIDANNATNCEIIPYGLSETNSSSKISIGECSATMHWVEESSPVNTETIRVYKLDEIIDTLNISQIDFIKMDIDGHEPAFFKGAYKTLAKFNPIILLEVSHINYLDYGVTAWDFYDQLIEMGYKIYYENDLQEFRDRKDFLQKCGNFTHSANIIVSRKELNSIICS